jgi:hypothetical protein
MFSSWRRLLSSQTFSRWPPKLFSNLVIHHLSAYEDVTECSEMSAYTIQTPGNYPEENIQQSRNFTFLLLILCTLPWLIQSMASSMQILKKGLELHSCISRLFCCNKTRHLISCTFQKEINILIYYLYSVTCLF